MEVRSVHKLKRFKQNSWPKASFSRKHTKEKQQNNFLQKSFFEITTNIFYAKTRESLCDRIHLIDVNSGDTEKICEQQNKPSVKILQPYNTFDFDAFKNQTVTFKKWIHSEFCA